MKNEKVNSVEEAWETLTFANNFIFCKIMESNPELCKHLLEILLHIEIDHLEKPAAEKTLKESIDSKSVRFDVYTKDKTRIFDLEIQTVDKKNLPKRARYYQSLIDTSNLSAGVNYNNLKDTYVIFLCLDDIFHYGLPVYTFENLCLENNQIKLKDGSFKVFFNAKDCDKLKSIEEKAFFRFLKGGKADNDFTKDLETKLSFARKNSEWRRQYMTWQQTIMDERYWARLEGHDEGYSEGREEGLIKGREEGLAEGRAEGITEGAYTKSIETAKTMLADNVPAEQVAKWTSLSLEEIKSL
ncbi:Rpn family recombination-promoting nuclease/putative transposase [Treponema sp.]|uniref:Rpn family recombination-promoting nuclease/putative transposase n=1 Tax=Treponema sp. TaxID=166 RepID=UPI00388E5EE2